MTVSGLSANMTQAQIATVGECKAAIRKAFIRAAADLNGGEWTVDDDAALDAATLWLAELVQRSQNAERRRPMAARL